VSPITRRFLWALVRIGKGLIAETEKYLKELEALDGQ
jgi:hypothetical protein